MAENFTLNSRLQHCVKTADDWKSCSIVPLAGEFCIESDTRKMKVGNGTELYSALKYANVTPEDVANIVASSSHTHSNKSILDATTASFTTALKSKLDNVAAGAEVNVQADWSISDTSSDAYIKNKPTKLPADGGNAATVGGHTVGVNVPADAKFTDTTYSAAGASLGLVKTGGDVTIDNGVITVKDNSHAHSIENVTGLQAALDAKIAATTKGSANGVAELDSTGKVPASQLPSFVDDVVEGYLNAGKLYKEEAHTSQINGETGKIYIDLHTNKTYRWSGSAFVVISDTIALGETSTTAYRGDKGKTAYDHSQAAHAPSNAEKNVIVGVKVNGATISPDSSRNVSITTPRKVSELTNDSGFITATANTASANKLKTPRTIALGGKATGTATSFDGSANVTIPVTSIDVTGLTIPGGTTLVLNGNF